MSEDRLVEIRKDFDRAKGEVVRLCQPGRKGDWRMTIPVDEQNDSDVIIMKALDHLSTITTFQANNDLLWKAVKSYHDGFWEMAQLLSTDKKSLKHEPEKCIGCKALATTAQEDK